MKVLLLRSIVPLVSRVKLSSTFLSSVTVSPSCIAARAAARVSYPFSPICAAYVSSAAPPSSSAGSAGALFGASALGSAGSSAPHTVQTPSSKLCAASSLHTLHTCLPPAACHTCVQGSPSVANAASGIRLNAMHTVIRHARSFLSFIIACLLFPPPVTKLRR